MKLDDVRKLHQKKFRDLLGHFLVEGEHLILELQKAARHNPALRRSTLYVTQEHAHWQGPFETHVIADHQMARISDTRKPQGMVAVVPRFPGSWISCKYTARSPSRGAGAGRTGTILRSLAWFGGVRCLLGPGSVDPYNAKVVRASMGAIFHVPVETDVAPESLPGRFARIAALDMQGERLQSGGFRTHDCYLFGNEARGLPRALLDSLHATPYTVPGCGAIESLNLASVVNMCLYELNR